MMLNLNQLRIFYFTAKLKSISEVARVLMVTPPAISKQIRQLESTLGLKLIFRDKNSIKLTKEAIRLFKQTKPIFEKVEKLENYLNKMGLNSSPVLKIGSTQTPGKYLMPYLISKFKKMYSNVKIIIDEGNTLEMIEALLNNKVELAIMRYIPNAKRIKAKAIKREPLLLVSAKKSKHIRKRNISIKELENLPLILPKEGSGIRDVIFEYLKKYNVNLNIIMESASVSLIKQLVLQDEGLTFLEKYTLKEELKRQLFQTINLNEGFPIVELGIAYTNKNILSPPAWAFLKMVDTLF